jgi:hypothetical protein
MVLAYRTVVLVDLLKLPAPTSVYYQKTRLTMENGSSHGFAVVIVEHSAEFIAAAAGRPRGLVLVAPGKAQEQGKRKWKLLERTQWVLQSHPEKVGHHRKRVLRSRS